MTVVPSVVRTPWRTQCQTCMREISTVAASSMRLSIATAPAPPTQAARYSRLIRTLVRSPSRLTPPPVVETSTSSRRPTATSGRWRSSWFGRSPRTAAKASRQVCTSAGCATQEPSKPRPASRDLSATVLSSAAVVASGLLRLGTKAAMPPIAWAPRAWQVLTSRFAYAAMNGLVIVTCERSGSTWRGSSAKFLIMEKM